MKNVLSVAYDDMFNCYRVCMDGHIVISCDRYETAEDAQDAVDSFMRSGGLHLSRRCCYKEAEND